MEVSNDADSLRLILVDPLVGRPQFPSLRDFQYAISLLDLYVDYPFLC